MIFGYLGAFGVPADQYPYMTLHVFLFNLTGGGILLLIHARGKTGPGAMEAGFLAGAFVFLAGVFFNLPALNIVAALWLGVLVESVRWKKYSWFPYEFFTGAPVSRKFEQASLLCLSLGLFIATGTIINNDYIHLVHFDKLDLHVFFLGFSFPLSLITYSLIFHRAENSGRPRRRTLEEFCFWGLNLGVIIFFVFIVLEIFIMQLVMALTLFITVWLTMYVHLVSGRRGPEWRFLISALFFLVAGSVTGIIYIIMLWKMKHYTSGYLLSLHSAANLFGWNLTWMMLTVRQGEFPLRAGIKFLVPLHWAFVLTIPAARVNPYFAVISIILCGLLLGLDFFIASKGPGKISGQILEPEGRPPASG